MSDDTRQKTYRCPHCGQPVSLAQLEREALSDQKAEPGPAATQQKPSIWDRKPAQAWPAFRRSEPTSPPAAAPSRDADDQPFAWLKTKPSQQPQGSPQERTPTSTSFKAIPKPAAPAKAKETKPKPAEPATAKATKQPPKKRDAAGVTVMDVLDTDSTLNKGQRETVRMIYQRFAPQVTASPSAASKSMRVLDALDTDPNLNDGQAETIRTIFAKFTPKT